MKICLILFSLFCSFAFAEVKIRDGKVSANILNQRLDIVVKLFRQQTDIEFYLEDDVRDQQICADFQNLSIGFGIKKLLEGTGINHAIIGNAEGTQSIFIGSSQAPQPSYKKLDNRSKMFRQRRPTSQAPSVLRPARPAKSNESDSKSAQPRIKSDFTIPTGGALTIYERPATSVHKNIPNTERQYKKK